MSGTKLGMTSHLTLIWLALVLSSGAQAAVPDKPPAPSAASTAILDTYGQWRIHCMLAPPVLPSGESVKLKHEWLNYKTAPPAPRWQEPEFDDISWFRGPVTLTCKSPLLAKVCLRGKFIVTDPDAVKDLKLTVGYKGGLAVTVNGKEVKREHLAAGAALADGLAGEARSLEALALPSSLLKKGTNVLGLELVRAPAPQAAAYYTELSCEIARVRLSAAGTAGLMPNVARPAGFQVWNADSMNTDLNVDYPDQAEALRPVRIAGARNGMFSGKVIAGSTTTIRGLKAIPQDLRGSTGVIPAANVHIRYGLVWNELMYPDSVPPYLTYANRLGALAETPPAEVAVRKPFRQFWQDYLRFTPDPDKVKPVDGAVIPVWITVEVPASAKAGKYAGTVRVEAQGEAPVAVPIELEVQDWVVPPTQDYRTWTDIVECPDTLALEYNVPLWSDKHFEMIAHSFKLLGETGCRILYLPLIAHTNLGNEESLVRWIKKGDNYDYDFSVLERYLDAAEKNMGKPKLIVALVWDVYMVAGPETADPDQRRSRQKEVAQNLLQKGGTLGNGPLVTVLDPATGKTQNVALPPYSDAAASRPQWKPLMDQLRERLRKRGLEGAMMLGLQGDAWATRQEHELFKELSGGAPWVLQSHEGFQDGKLMYGISKIGYQARVWSVSYSDDNADRPPGYRGGVASHRGWARPELVAGFDRGEPRLQAHPNTRWRDFAEVQITGGQRGPGRLGGENWPVLRNKKGERAVKVYERYPESNWRLLIIPTSLLAPGPDGPVATDMLESYREGVTECEALIVLEKALGDDAARVKLGPELAKRCADYLYARHMMLWLTLAGQGLSGTKEKPGDWRCGWRWGVNTWGNTWFLGSNWRARTAQLYSLAGEVARKVGAQ